MEKYEGPIYPASFENQFTLNGVNSNSIADYFLYYADGIDFENIQLYDDESIAEVYRLLGNDIGYGAQQAFLGYQSYIIDPISNNINSNINTEDSIDDNTNKCNNCIYVYSFEINTLGVGPDSEIVDEPKIPAALKIKKDDSIHFQGIIGIEIRGESSQFFDKKSYGIETWDTQYNDVDVSLLGFPEEEDWILHGPYSCLLYTSPSPRDRG